MEPASGGDASDIDGRAFLAERAGASESTAATYALSAAPGAAKPLEL